MACLQGATAGACLVESPAELTSFCICFEVPLKAFTALIACLQAPPRELKGLPPGANGVDAIKGLLKGDLGGPGKGPAEGAGKGIEFGKVVRGAREARGGACGKA